MQVCLSTSTIPSARLNDAPVGADIHAGRVSAVLAHHRQRLAGTGFGMSDIDFSDPLGIGGWSAMPLQTIFPVAGAYAVITTFVTTAHVDQHAPTHVT